MSEPSNVVRLPQYSPSRPHQHRSAQLPGSRPHSADEPLQGPWLDADQAWRYLGFGSRKALYHAVRRGQVPAHRLGKRRFRFNRGELDAVLSARSAYGVQC